MEESIEASRNSCALHGAIQTIQGIEGFIPIIHSTAGCGIQQYLGGIKSSGCSGSGYSGGFAIPSSNVAEKQVIFGGTSRLREQIKNTVKVIKGDAYVVVTGCTTELVGDDIFAMTKESLEQGYPVIAANTPGFKGQVHFGYELILKSILKQLGSITTLSTEKNKGLINIFGIIPEQDIYWRGNLEEIKRILESLGLKVNTLFGNDQGIKEWGQIPSAELNLVFSTWGLTSAQYLEETYGTPFISLNNIPVGFKDTADFVEIVSAKLNLNQDTVNEYIKKEEKYTNYYIDNILDIYFDYNFQKEFAIIGDSSTALGISRFLVKSFGLIPKTIIITDNVAEDYRQKIEVEFLSLLPSEEPTVYFIDDLGQIEDILKISNIDLIIGSSLEKRISKNLNIPLQIISFPLTDKVILNKTYVGFKGSLTLLEDLSTEILSFEKNKIIKVENMMQSPFINAIL